MGQGYENDPSMMRWNELCHVLTDAILSRPSSNLLCENFVPGYSEDPPPNTHARAHTHTTATTMPDPHHAQKSSIVMDLNQ